LRFTVEERVLGVLWLWDGALQEDDIPVISVFAGQAANALENARLFEQADRTQHIAAVGRRHSFLF